jgi:hypothetical protein
MISNDLIKCATGLQQSTLDMEICAGKAPSEVEGGSYTSHILQDMLSCAQQAAIDIDMYVQKIVTDLRALEIFEEAERVKDRVAQRDLVLLSAKCAKQAEYIRRLVQESAARQCHAMANEARDVSYEELLREYFN